MSPRRPIHLWWLPAYLCCCCIRIGIGIGSQPSFLPLATTFGAVVAVAVNPSPDFSPSAFLYKHGQDHEHEHDDDNGGNANSEEIDLGTTLVAIKYSDGVIVGADTRTSVGGYVSNKLAYKINPIFEPDDADDVVYLNEEEDDDDDENSASNPKAPPPPYSSCVLCRSGSAADTQYLARLARRRFQRRKLERPGYRPSVSEVAHYLRYQMRSSNSERGDGGLQASLICAGYDERFEAGRIFGITPGGSLWEEDNFCVSGSGSTILLGYLDDLQQSQSQSQSTTTAATQAFQKLSKDEAVALVIKLLRLSIGRDGSSGGLVRLYVIDRTGLEERTVYPFSDSGSGASATTTGPPEKTSHAELKGFAAPTSN